MIDQRAYQCNRRRSLVLWRGRQWSVTSNGVETTDARVPHVVIPPQDLDRTDDIMDGRYSPLVQRDAAWFDQQEFVLVVAHAKMFHQPKAGRSKW